MKIQFRQIDGFLKSPPAQARAVLVYGPDRGLMKARSGQLAAALKVDPDDPFSSVSIDGDTLAEDSGRLAAEGATISLMGGLRFIRVLNADDGATVAVKEYLATATKDSIVLLEAGELGPRSSLRLLCEKAENAAALPCYVEEERDLAGLVRQKLTDAGKRIAPDALAIFCETVAGDRQQVMNEIEKLVIYMGNEGDIRAGDVDASLGRAGAPSFDDLTDAYLLKDRATALSMCNAMLAEGTKPIVIIRALLNHVRRVHRVKCDVASGITVEDSMEALSPPVFFKRKPDFKKQVAGTRFDELNAVMGDLLALEAASKKTGTPVETLLAHTLLRAA